VTCAGSRDISGSACPPSLPMCVAAATLCRTSCSSTSYAPGLMPSMPAGRGAAGAVGRTGHHARLLACAQYPHLHCSWSAGSHSLSLSCRGLLLPTHSQTPCTYTQPNPLYLHTAKPPANTLPPRSDRDHGQKPPTHGISSIHTHQTPAHLRPPSSCGPPALTPGGPAAVYGLPAGTAHSPPGPPHRSHAAALLWAGACVRACVRVCVSV